VTLSQRPKALDAASPSASKPLTFFYTHVSPKAVERVTAVLRSGWLNEGEVTREFECEMARVLGLSHPVAVNSGTSALHLALVLAGVGSGDEVILPAQTFVATALVILMQGATPVFADIDPHTGNIDPRSITGKITPRTKALMPVHWGGCPCDMQEINAFATRHGLAVIEDAAHALGATYQGKPIGAVSRFAAFSFQAIKHLTTGDGGLLCCLSEEDAREARRRRWFGIDRASVQRSIIGDRGYDISVLGYKYHMNNVAAALGLGNLEDFPSRLTRRQQIGAFYRKELASVPGLELLRVDPDRTHAYWVFTVLVERRQDFARKLAEEGIPTTVVDLSIDRNSVFGGIRDDLPGQAEFNERQIAIPLHEGLSENDLEKVVTTVCGGW